MGTEISLAVGGIDVAWSKNSRGIDHGMLFQATDLASEKSSQVNYEYCEEHNQETDLYERAYVRSLGSLVPRLELLGYTLENVEKEYKHCIQRAREEFVDFDEESREAPNYLSFKELCAFISNNPIDTLSNTFVTDDSKVQGRFKTNTEFEKIPFYDFHDLQAYSERTFFGGLIGFLVPYTQLRLLAVCEPNLELKVIWNFGTLVENGWAKESEFIPNARRHQRVLIATEGSSDTHIIKNAISILAPAVLDFFQFIDVSESHPFSGASNLVKFAEGLAKIDVQNNILFVFDNDAEGVYAHKRFSELPVPSNMHGLTLPAVSDLENFSVVGPEGVSESNINGKAAAIECYLDLNFDGHPPPVVRWSNYHKNLEQYQGALEYKESYVKSFLRLKSREQADLQGYNLEKIEVVLRSIFKASTKLASQKMYGVEHYNA